MRILIAEPSRIGRSILLQLLEGAGHELLTCDTAENALALIEADETIECLITAIEFIGMSGLELCWSARLAIGTQRPLCIVVMSASADELKLAEALDSGADEFISKPPRKTELLARLRSVTRMIEGQKTLIRLASFDSLTGLRNRRAFFEMLEEEEKKAEISSIITLDIDHFKRVNDTHGHDGGDMVLKEVARRLQKLDPRFARVGGEEFALLVKGPIEMAGAIAETARREIAVLPVKLPDCTLDVTISLGVAERSPGTKFELVLKEADIALYASKSGGRNRATLARVSGNTHIFEDSRQHAA